MRAAGAADRDGGVHQGAGPPARCAVGRGGGGGRPVKVLLQKVEELTLHVIELQKQIDELKNQQR